MGTSARELLRILAIAACAAGALLPFYGREQWPWLWTGAGLAAAAGLVGVVVNFLTSRRRSAMGVVGGTFARLCVAIASLCVCFFVVPGALTEIALALLVAYLAILASEIVCAQRQARAADHAEVQR